MKWELLARHKRQCPKCESGLRRKYKNLWSKEIKHIGIKAIGMECKKEDCDFFITIEKLKELAPSKKQLKARREAKRFTNQQYQPDTITNKNHDDAR